jgi:hypothetical protein
VLGGRRTIWHTFTIWKSFWICIVSVVFFSYHQRMQVDENLQLGNIPLSRTDSILTLFFNPHVRPTPAGSHRRKQKVGVDVQVCRFAGWRWTGFLPGAFHHLHAPSDKGRTGGFSLIWHSRTAPRERIEFGGLYSKVRMHFTITTSRFFTFSLLYSLRSI